MGQNCYQNLKVTIERSLKARELLHVYDAYVMKDWNIVTFDEN